MKEFKETVKKEVPTGEILNYIADTKTAGIEWELSDERVKQLAREGIIKAKKIGNSWAIDMRQENPKTYNKLKETDNNVSKSEKR